MKFYVCSIYPTAMERKKVGLMAAVSVSAVLSIMITVVVYNMLNWMNVELPKVEEAIYQWCIINPDGIVSGDLHYECNSFIPEYERRMEIASSTAIN